MSVLMLRIELSFYCELNQPSERVHGYTNNYYSIIM